MDRLLGVQRELPIHCVQCCGLYFAVLCLVNHSLIHAPSQNTPTTPHTNHISSEADQEELSKLRKLLCIPKADREAVHMELCGSVYRAAVESAVTTGIDGFDSDERQKVCALAPWWFDDVVLFALWHCLHTLWLDKCAYFHRSTHTRSSHHITHDQPHGPPSSVTSARHRSAPSSKTWRLPTPKPSTSLGRSVVRLLWALCDALALKTTAWSRPRS